MQETGDVKGGDIKDRTEQESHVEEVLGRKVTQNSIRFKSDMRCLLVGE